MAWAGQTRHRSASANRSMHVGCKPARSADCAADRALAPRFKIDATLPCLPVSVSPGLLVTPSHIAMLPAPALQPLEGTAMRILRLSLALAALAAVSGLAYVAQQAD